jgi:hypothetical protein
MIKKILKLFFPKKNEIKENKNNSEANYDLLKYSNKNLPFFLNYEYSFFGKGSKLEGYFIDSDGNILSYNMPERWNFYTSSKNPKSDDFLGSETDGQISPEHLFENLNSLKKKNGHFSLIKTNMDEIVKSLNESGFENKFGGCDMGIRSYSILIFDDISGQYKRIILKTLGNIRITNKSFYTSELLKRF